MKALVTQAIFTSFTSKADKSLTARLTTPELTPVERAQFMEIQNLNVRLLIEPIDYPTDGKAEIKNPLGAKSPSSRLRAILFVLWSQLKEKGKMDKNYEEFYTQQYEVIINSYKEQLDPET